MESHNSRNSKSPNYPLTVQNMFNNLTLSPELSRQQVGLITQEVILRVFMLIQTDSDH
jgi:hypothetical protein